MSDKTARVSAEVSREMKLGVQLIAQREDKSEAELLRDLVNQRLAEEDIPEEVLDFFEQGQETDLDELLSASN